VLADFSEPMLEQAHQQLKEYAGQLVFENLDYGDPAWVTRIQSYGPFDAIVSGYSIHHQPDARKRPLYEEIYSLLKPGGWFINIEHIAPACDLTRDLFYNHMIDGRYVIEQANGGSQTRQEIADALLNDPAIRANILLPVEIQCDWLREIGYEEVDCYLRIYELAVFGGHRPN
jgi:SAM-dependent methyltransferase